MGTEILRPQDCLVERMRISGQHAAFPFRIVAAKPRSGRKVVRPDPKPTRSGNNMMIGQVTILKRGESLPEKTIQELGARPSPTPAAVTLAGDLIVCGTQRLGPDPVKVPMFHFDVYAGSGFFNSPEPSDLPLPNFSRKKLGVLADDSATKDLRRLLRARLMAEIFKNGRSGR